MHWKRTLSVPCDSIIHSNNIGLAIHTTTTGITLDQTKYVNERLQPAVLKGGDSKRLLDREEQKLLRQLTGQINWAATQSRPDLSFSVVEISTQFKHPLMEDLKKANKAINKLTTNPVKVFFPKIKGKLKIVMYSDAAFWNLPDQTSSGQGHIIFLTGEENRSAPLSWSSNKVKRVVGSTLAAEAMSLQEAIGHAIYLRAVLAETVGVKEEKIPIVSYVDSNNLYQAIWSTKAVDDKRLRIRVSQNALYVENKCVQWFFPLF